MVDNFDPFYPRAIKTRNLQQLAGSDGFRLVEADIRSLEDVRAAIGADHDFDAMVHLAARAGVRPSIQQPRLYQQTNVVGTQNLLELAREWEVPHFVFGSSSSVYGINPNVPWSESDPVLLPISPYASTKVSGELLGHVYSHLYGIRFVALRFFTVYGPRQRPDLAIHRFARSMLAGEPITVFGDGSSSRDYTFVDDIVAGIMAAVEFQGSSYEIINLGNDRTVSLVEMINALEEVLGVRANRQPLPMQPGDVPQTWADISKARQLLAYDPQTNFKDGLSRFAEWLRTQPEPTANHNSAPAT